MPHFTEHIGFIFISHYSMHTHIKTSIRLRDSSLGIFLVDRVLSISVRGWIHIYISYMNFHNIHVDKEEDKQRKSTYDEDIKGRKDIQLSDSISPVLIYAEKKT